MDATLVKLLAGILFSFALIMFGRFLIMNRGDLNLKNFIKHFKYNLISKILLILAGIITLFFVIDAICLMF
jgi:hypothetical protein